MSGLTIALIANIKPVRKAKSKPEDYYSECDSWATVQAIAAALKQSGHKVFPVEADEMLPLWLAENPVHLAFNIAEGFHGEAREARIPALLELMGIPYTGSGVLALALGLDKVRCKQLFKAAGVPTPKFQLFTDSHESLDPGLQYPLIVKPNREGSGKGISKSSVVYHEQALRGQIRQVLELYAQEVLVEEFIAGTELTVGVLENDKALPVLETDFTDCRSSGEFFYSWRMKEYQGNESMGLTPKFYCPARLNPEITQVVQRISILAAQTIGVRDFARVDLRLSTEGIPYVLEVNPLPGLDPEESNLPMMAAATGMPFPALIQRIVTSALRRWPELNAQNPLLKRSEQFQSRKSRSAAIEGEPSDAFFRGMAPAAQSLSQQWSAPPAGKASNRQDRSSSAVRRDQRKKGVRKKQFRGGDIER